ncbi:deaminase domain-containing protein [Microcoleus sp. OTE_8_concoct_300]|uniref:deaminase domain-containing protein n=1 Tax=Microcoleus sp. OTE_8_concoct_300 TaxID=2964710 RepID=UPI00403F62B6
MTKNLTTGNPSRNTPHYEYPQDIPDGHRDMVEELRTKAQDVRAFYIRKPRLGNAAAAKLELETGLFYSKEATSKPDPLNIPGKEDGPKLFFEARIDRQKSFYNEHHAEYKIFNALAEDLERDDVSLEVEGILYLYTERDMCSGCNITCDEDFNMRFQNIKVIIFYERPYP